MLCSKPTHMDTLQNQLSCETINIANSTTCQQQVPYPQTYQYAPTASQSGKQGVDRQFWRKLRMIRKCQYCRFCQDKVKLGLGELWGKYGGDSSHWVNNRAKLDIQQLVGNHSGGYSPSMLCSMDNKLNTSANIRQDQSVKTSIVIIKPSSLLAEYHSQQDGKTQLRRLTDYYRYYQYMPVMPVSPNQTSPIPATFSILHTYMNKKIQLIYATIKNQLSHKSNNNQDSLEKLGVNQKYDQFQVHSRSYESSSHQDQQESDEEEVSNSKSFESVCNILDHLYKNNDHFISSFGNSPEREIVKGDDSQVRQNNTNKAKQFQKNKNKQQQSNSKNKDKNVKNDKYRQFHYNKSQSNKSRRNLNDDLSTKRIVAFGQTSVSMKKIKKNKVSNSCGNLQTINTGLEQTKKIKEDQMRSKKNCKKSQFESARASVSNKKKNMNTITNLKDYIIDLKKKINADKQHFRTTHSHYEPKQNKNEEISCFQSTNSKLNSIDKRRNLDRQKNAQEVEDFSKKIENQKIKSVFKNQIKRIKKLKGQVPSKLSNLAQHKKSVKFSASKLEDKDKNKRHEEKKIRITTQSQKKIKKIIKGTTEVKKLKKSEQLQQEKKRQVKLKKQKERCKGQDQQGEQRQKIYQNFIITTTQKKKKGLNNIHSSITTEF